MTFHPTKVRVMPGYERARVLNPWVFANYGQPQRRRGYVSPRVFQSHASLPRSAYLGEVAPVDETTSIMRRMQTLSYISTALAAVGVYLAFRSGKA